MNKVVGKIVKKYIDEHQGCRTGDVVYDLAFKGVPVDDILKALRHLEKKGIVVGKPMEGEDLNKANSKREQPLNRRSPSPTSKNGGRKQMASKKRKPTKKQLAKLLTKNGKIQTAFILHNDYDMTAKDIGEALNISPRTVNAYIWRVKSPEKYKELLGRYLEKKKAQKKS